MEQGKEPGGKGQEKQLNNYLLSTDSVPGDVVMNKIKEGIKKRGYR